MLLLLVKADRPNQNHRGSFLFFYILIIAIGILPGGSFGCVQHHEVCNFSLNNSLYNGGQANSTEYFFSQIIQPNPGFYEVHKLRNVDPVIFNPVRIIRSKSDVKVKKQMKYLEDKEVEILDIVFESEDDEDNLTSEEHEIQESHKSKRLVLQKYFAMTHEYR